MLDAEAKATEGLEDENGEDIDLISQMADMSMASSSDQKSDENALDRANPVFEDQRPSSKILTVLAELKKLRQRSVVSFEIILHWGLGIGSTDTEAVSVYVKEGGLDIRTVVSVSVQRSQSNLKQKKIIEGFDGLNIESS
jgi:hypothetical protein